MGTLGECLAQNIAREKQAATDIAAAWEQQRTDEERKKFTTAKRFFDDAREYFTRSIMNHEPVAKLYRQVGGARYGSESETHPEFCAVLEGYQCRDQKLGPSSLHDPKRFAALWREFQAWAEGEGLVASWVYCWDGGGMDSWWQLRVKVKA